MQQMSFWEHLDALRSTLIRMAVTLFGAMAVLFVAMPGIFDTVILWPCRGDFPLYQLLGATATAAGGAWELFAGFDGGDFAVELININLGSQLMVQMSTSVLLALVLTFPVLVYQLWSFVAPGLYAHERRHARKAFLFANTMFYIGVATGYFMVFPLALRFLSTYQLSASITNTITLDSYIDNFMTISLLMGVVFELPLLAWLLGKAGILTRRFFSRYRRHAIVALLVAAGFITPTADPFSMFAVFLPLYILWEGAAWLVPEGDAGAVAVAEDADV